MTRHLIACSNSPAREWAYAFFDRLRDGEDPIASLRWMTKEGSTRAVCDILKAFARQGPVEMLAIVRDAEGGWGLADQALRELCSEALGRKEQLPAASAAYMQKAMLIEPTKNAGAQKADKWLRNLAIAFAVTELVARFGIPAAGRKGSACEAVARASRMLTHKAVEKIWRDWGRWVGPLEIETYLQSFT